MPHMTKISNSSAGSDILSSATTNPSSVDEYHDSRQLHVASQPHSLGPISPAIAGFNFGSEPTSPTSPNAPVQFSNSLNQSMKQDDWGIDASQNGRGEIEKQKKSQEESRKRTQYFDDQFAYKDGSVSSTAERVRYESPVIAELRTNVIVCFPSISHFARPLTQCRSRTSTPWSPICPLTLPCDTSDQNSLS